MYKRCQCELYEGKHSKDEIASFWYEGMACDFVVNPAAPLSPACSFRNV